MTVLPKATEALPKVIVLLAKLLLAIDDPVDNKVPDSFGNTRALSPPVASAADYIVSFASAVEPSKILCPD